MNEKNDCMVYDIKLSMLHLREEFYHNGTLLCQSYVTVNCLLPGLIKFFSYENLGFLNVISFVIHV